MLVSGKKDRSLQLSGHQKYSSESPSSMIVCGDNNPFRDHLPIPMPFPSPLVGECVIVGDNAGDDEAPVKDSDLGDRIDAATAVSRSVRGRRLRVSCFARREARYWDRLLRAGFGGGWGLGSSEGLRRRRVVRRVVAK